MSRYGIKFSDFKKELERESFNDMLPWIAQDPDEKKILTQEGAVGYIWECTPLAFMNDKTADILSGIMNLDFTDKATIQFVLYADDHVEPFLQRFLNLGTRRHPVMDRWAESYARYLQSGKHGLEKMSQIPTRIFRLFVCVKNGENESEISDDTIRGIEDYLTGANLQPQRIEAEDLLEVARGMLGSKPLKAYDRSRPIRKQVLGAEDHVDVYRDYIKIGKRYAKVITPKTLPEKIDVLKANELLGGIYGNPSDSSQITTPFIYTITILPHSAATSISTKLEMMNFQRSKGSFLNQVNKRIAEYDWALSISDRTKFMRIIPSLVVLADSESKMRNTAARVRKLWEGKGAAMQEETLIQTTMLLASLPLGYYNVGKFTDMLDRYMIVPTEVAARMLPVQADFIGHIHRPAIPFVGRKGELIGLDIYDPRSANQNFLIAAAPGSGKSVLTQMILLCMYRMGYKVRILDLGFSYRKMTSIIDGKFLDIADNFTLNPFDQARNKQELEIIKPIIAQMAFSYSKRKPDEVESNLLSAAVEWAFDQNQPERGVTLVVEYLKTYPKYANEAKSEVIESVVEKARTLAFTLRDYAEGGQYAEYVHGKSSIDIENDDWVVLELENLMPREQLFSVIVLMIINMITRSLYLTPEDKRVQTIILFDEAWKFLRQIGESSAMVAMVIEEGFRRARKYYGAFGVVTQSVADTDKFGAAGDVILTSTQYKMFLNEPSYKKAKDKGIINYDPFEMQLLTSVTSQLPRYSEIFIDGGEAFGIGATRLTLDNYSYAIMTSHAGDNRIIGQYKMQGMSYAEAIEKFTEQIS